MLTEVKNANRFTSTKLRSTIVLHNEPPYHWYVVLWVMAHFHIENFQKKITNLFFYFGIFLKNFSPFKSFKKTKETVPGAAYTV